MKKPKLKVEINPFEDGFKWAITHKGLTVEQGPGKYTSEEQAATDAEARKVELQEEMMAEAMSAMQSVALGSPVANFKVKKPRKARAAKPAVSKFPEACAFLDKAVNLIGSISIKEAGENFERLSKAMETITNVKADLEGIEC
jgi:hypothetical protein